MIVIKLGDCREGMAEYENDYFDLAIVDPPYGQKGFGADSRIAKYGQMKTVNDMKPDGSYFKELFRVSKNQIIWGYNHLSDLLPSSSAFIFWYKHQPVKSYSDGELAWTSFKGIARCFNYPYAGARNMPLNRIHPTQKPVKLYEWLLFNYAKPDYKILDTHLGSGSSAIAADNFGIKEFVGFEIDKDYYQEASKRFKDHKAQGTLFSGFTSEIKATNHKEPGLKPG